MQIPTQAGHLFRCDPGRDLDIARPATPSCWRASGLWSMPRLSYGYRRITDCDADHEPPIIVRANGRPELVEKVGGVALGCMEGVPYRYGELRLAPGDLVLLYTDGITEALDENEDFFSRSRLLTTLGEIGAAGGPESVTHKLMIALDDFRGEAPQADDITLIALRYLGAAGVARTPELAPGAAKSGAPFPSHNVLLCASWRLGGRGKAGFRPSFQGVKW